jgi:hypothetical protein
MAFIGVVFKGILDYKDLPFYHHFDAITLLRSPITLHYFTKTGKIYRNKFCSSFLEG